MSQRNLRTLMQSRLHDLSFLAPNFFKTAPTREPRVHSTSSRCGWGSGFLGATAWLVLSLGPACGHAVFVVVRGIVLMARKCKMSSDDASEFGFLLLLLGLC